MEKLRHDQLNHGVNIVTAAYKGKYRGLAVAWATQLAADRILICVGSQSSTREYIIASQAFGVCVLRKDQLELARLLGRKSSIEIDKFKGLAVHTAKTGSPLLDDCAHICDCRVDTVFEDGNHKLFVGKIVDAQTIFQNYEPLIYREEDY